MCAVQHTEKPPSGLQTREDEPIDPPVTAPAVSTTRARGDALRHTEGESPRRSGAPPALRRAVKRIQRLDGPAVTVVVAVVVWILWMYLHVWRRHDRYGTFDNDLGFHSQYVWLLSQGKSFSSILGLPVFGHNATFGYVFFVPFAWLGAGPQFIDFAQTVAVGLGAWPVFLLAQRRIESRWACATLAVVYLLHPVVTGNVWETFHPEAMAMAPLLGAVLAAEQGKWRRFAGLVLFAMLWKTDVALFVMMLGIRVGRRHDRRMGVATFAAGAVWFTVCVSLLIPHYSGGGTVFGPLYGELGDTPFEVARTGLEDPTAITERVADNEPYRYFRDLAVPYGFVPVLAPGTLALGAPQFAVNLLAEPHFTRDPFDNPHYQALPVVALTLALIDAIGRIRRSWARPSLVVVGAVAVLVLVFAMSWSAIPNGSRRSHYWSEDDDPLRADKDAAIALVGPDAPVSATYLFVPHLTRREVVYSFPNPWLKVFYGVEDTELPDPARVEWLAIDTALLNDEFRDVYACVIESGSFELQQQSADETIEVWQRIPGRTDDRDCQRG
jgi:uncharacterized membrane protein